MAYVVAAVCVGPQVRHEAQKFVLFAAVQGDLRRLGFHSRLFLCETAGTEDT